MLAQNVASMLTRSGGQSASSMATIIRGIAWQRSSILRSLSSRTLEASREAAAGTQEVTPLGSRDMTMASSSTEV